MCADKFQRAQRFSAQGQAAQRGVGFQARVVRACPRPATVNPSLPVTASPWLRKPFDPGHVDARALGIQLEAAGVEIVAARGRNLAGRLAHGHRGQLDHLVGNRALGPDARHRLAIDAAAVQLDPSGAAQRTERPVRLEAAHSSVPVTGRFCPRSGSRSSRPTLPAAKMQVEHGVGVERRRRPSGRPASSVPLEGDLGLSAAQQAVLNDDARGRVAARSLDRIQANKLRLAGFAAGSGLGGAAGISTTSCVAFRVPARCGSTSEPVQVPWRKSA